MKPNNAFSILEVMVGLALLSVVTYAVLQFLQGQRQVISGLEQKEKLSDVLMENVTEINARNAKSLPSPDYCWVRYYDLQGNLVSESATQILQTSAECNDPIPTSPQIKILWKIFKSDQIDVTFTPSDSLKLPHFVPTVKEVQILGGIRDATAKSNTRQISVTVYRRDE